MRKVQVWLRPDQADCVVTVMDYMHDRFNGQQNHELPVVRCAAQLARERVVEIKEAFEAAIAKAKGRHETA